MAVLIAIYLFFVAYMGLIVERASPVEFTTVSELEGKYDEPIRFVFHWNTIDELTAGKGAFVRVDAYNLPYYEPDSVNYIQIRFDGTSYYSSNVPDVEQSGSTNVEVPLKLTNANDRKYVSEQTRVTYVTGGKWGAWLCDHNTKTDCSKIPDIIEVQPHSTSAQMDIARSNSTIIKVALGISLISVWIVLRREYMETNDVDATKIKTTDESNISTTIQQIEQRISEQDVHIRDLQILQQIESMKRELSNLKDQVSKKSEDN